MAQIPARCVVSIGIDLILSVGVISLGAWMLCENHLMVDPTPANALVKRVNATDALMLLAMLLAVRTFRDEMRHVHKHWGEPNSS